MSISVLIQYNKHKRVLQVDEPSITSLREKFVSSFQVMVVYMHESFVIHYGIGRPLCCICFLRYDSRFDEYVDIGEDETIADRDKISVTVLSKDDKIHVCIVLCKDTFSQLFLINRNQIKIQKRMCIYLRVRH